MRISRARWLYLAIFCLVNLCAGSLYAWSVFSGPLAERLTELSRSPVSTTDLGLIFSVASAVNPFAMIAGGWVNDRFGPRMVIPVGGLMIGGGLCLSAVVESYAALVVVYGILFGLGVGLTYTSTIGSAIKFFPDRRGLAGGIACMSYGLSSMVLPPVASAMIVSFGIERTLLLLGLVTGLAIFIGGAVSRKCPDDLLVQLCTEQKSQERAETDAEQTSSAKAKSSADLNWRQMIATPMFWAMLLFFIAGSTAAMMMISSASFIAQKQAGMTAAAAALVVSLLAVMNAFGRLVAGMASDRLGRLPVLFLSIVLAIAGLLLLTIAGKGDSVLFTCGACLTVLCYGGFVGIYPGFTVDQFGTKHNSVNYGIMAAGFSCGGIIGPWILRSLQTDAGFTTAYAAAIGVCIVGLVFGLLCVKLQRAPA